MTLASEYNALHWSLRFHREDLFTGWGWVGGIKGPFPLKGERTAGHATLGRGFLINVRVVRPRTGPHTLSKHRVPPNRGTQRAAAGVWEGEAETL